jgi:hypothetical protein
LAYENIIIIVPRVGAGLAGFFPGRTATVRNPSKNVENGKRFLTPTPTNKMNFLTSASKVFHRIKTRFHVIALTACLMVPALLQGQTNSTESLPSLESVLARIARVVSKEAYYQSAFNHHYVYFRSRITEVTYSSGRSRVIEERFNTNSPPPEIAAQPIPAYNPAESTAKEADDQFIDVDELVTNVLARAQLTVVGRDILDGRPMLVIDFKPPKQRVPDDSLIDRLINRGIGRAWVDEQDYALAKLETHLLEKLNIFGGVAGAVYDGSYSSERQRTPEGIWYSRNIEWNADVRELIFHRKLAYHERFLDVHKPEAAVAATIQSLPHSTSVRLQRSPAESGRHAG